VKEFDIAVLKVSHPALGLKKGDKVVLLLKASGAWWVELVSQTREIVEPVPAQDLELAA
jgi:hypothetical protein